MLLDIVLLFQLLHNIDRHTVCFKNVHKCNCFANADFKSVLFAMIWFLIFANKARSWNKNMEHRKFPYFHNCYSLTSSTFWQFFVLKL